jgi:Uma2 family endonuclease
MSTEIKHRMSIAEFYDWALTQPDGRFELVEGEVVRMAPERLRHNVAKLDIAVVLKAALASAGRTNAVFTDGVHIKTGPATSRGPDCLVAVGHDHDMDAMSIDDPLIVVEVVSPDSEDRDTIEKLAEYFRLPTVAHYLIVWPKEGYLEHFTRNGLDGPSKATLKAGDQLRLDPPGIEVDVAPLLAAAKG